MKIGVATTTINVPTALQLYHAHDPDVGFFVAGDLKTPEAECADVVNQCGANSFYLSVEKQKALGYKCSELIGWNQIARRNIAILECLRWGADVIVLLDDDNLAVDRNYFQHFRRILTQPLSLAHPAFSGLEATSESGWFDVGSLLYSDHDNSACPHRGFPHALSSCSTSTPAFSPITDAKVGVAAGICMGDPDISAVQRIARGPIVNHTSKLLDAGIVVDPRKTRTVYNSQNTAFIRELAPCFLMVPQFGRHDDIFASIIAQQVMAARNLHVHFGEPFIWQQRNAHNLIKDLEAEIWGMKHILNFSEAVANAPMRRVDVSITNRVRDIYDHLHHTWPDCPRYVGQLADAWLEDIESVL